MTDAVKYGAEAVKDKVSEVTSGASYEVNKTAAKDSDRSIGDRIGHGVDAVKDKFDEKKSEVSKDANKNAAEHEAKGLVETMKEKAAEAYNYVAGAAAGVAGAAAGVAGEGGAIVGTVKEKATEAYNYVAEKVSEATHAVTGDANKEVAKDSSQQSAGSRVDGVKDKLNEKLSDGKA